VPKQLLRPVPIGPTGHDLMAKVERGQTAKARVTKPATRRQEGARHKRRPTGGSCLRDQALLLTASGSFCLRACHSRRSFAARRRLYVILKDETRVGGGLLAGTKPMRAASRSWYGAPSS
jgi:hypothetical protein